MDYTEQKERQALYDKLNEAGTNYMSTELQEISISGLQRLIAIHQAKNQPIEKLLSELKTAGGDPDEYKHSSKEAIQSAINTQQMLNEYKKELEHNTYISDLQAPETGNDLARFQMYEERMNDSPFLLDSEQAKIEHNLKVEAENRLRVRLGLDEKPLKLLSGDLQILLSLGEDSQKEYLSKIEDPLQRQEIKQDLKNLKNLQEAESLRRKRELLTLSNLWTAYEKLQPQPEKLIRDGENFILSPKYNEWLKSLNDLDIKISKQIRALQSIETHMGEKVDRRASIFRLQDKTSELIEGTS